MNIDLNQISDIYFKDVKIKNFYHGDTRIWPECPDCEFSEEKIEQSVKEQTLEVEASLQAYRSNYEVFDSLSNVCSLSNEFFGKTLSELSDQLDFGYLPEDYGQNSSDTEPETQQQPGGILMVIENRSCDTLIECRIFTDQPSCRITMGPGVVIDNEKLSVMTTISGEYLNFNTNLVIPKLEGQSFMYVVFENAYNIVLNSINEDAKLHLIKDLSNSMRFDNVYWTSSIYRDFCLWFGNRTSVPEVSAEQLAGLPLTAIIEVPEQLEDEFKTHPVWGNYDIGT